MVEIKVNVQVDLSEKTTETEKTIKALKDFFATITSQEEQKAKQEEKPASTAKQEEKPAPKSEPAKQAEAAKSSIGIEDVRKVLALKVNDHRDAIKEKLNELGAPSVTKLAKEKYQEMYDFLISL